jgi:pyruvate kinase
VANAILDGADCVMLSGETAKGNYPVESVRTMHDVCILAEAVICYPAVFNEIRSLTALPTGTTETIACAAVSAAHEQNAGAIVVLSTSGNSARLLSKYRPYAPIIVVTRNPMAARQVHLYRGCFPFIYDKPAPSHASAHTIDSPQNFSPADNAPWQEDVDNRIMWGRQGELVL